ncbi:glutamine ABC transporter substrate-binding protein [Bacillus cereus]|jgi:aspartate/glutamate/glutamine transport system substrate-binding protein|uniref:Glutamine ABC transporter substrate-binding protein n=1 Tax=Bacillus paramycoides TaxID=2026194 RepID=A0A1J9V017_9BACI|nr:MULTISPECIES: glutamine ABC transporter substrate-binding protein GlnH [Bacillus]PFD38533.1 glutamine ABC transporter substrate-binding protein [Bacillus cereus]KMN46263.1 glutamine ABC transporter substrate-binding protein [Bacillus sp. LK2]MCW9134549.1 glutamine ABC transporter substrate-binding protein GlnH [Bacillus paramycoides]MED0958740.1 glutamine ABC transporter substrate-binding protein GlnH [Bacillus paramycoides]MED0971930.1 glutamine ABC transporter substrate-binding protein Gl
MLKMKKLFTLIVFSCLFVLVVAGCGNKKDEAKETNTKQGGVVEQIKKRGKLVVGVKNDTNLFGLKNPSTGKVEGFDIDVAKALAKKILGDENKLELKEVTSKTRIPMLKNGDIDVIIATMTITEERKKEVDFSDVYFKAGQSLLVKKGSNIKSIDDVKKDVKVLAVKGSTSTNNIRQKAPEATVLEFENYSEAFTALKAGKGDVLTTDNAILYGMAKQDANYEVVGKIFTDEPYGIAVQKGADDLTKEINSLLKDMKANGEYDKLYEKWIGQKQEK